ncbi:MAG: family 1 glycosylhydrolase [Myxococcota bacterium]
MKRVLVVGLGVVLVGYVVAVVAFSGRYPTEQFGAEAQTTPLSFPQGFLWGTATAAHQVEGGNTRNDWAAFEAEPGNIRNNDRSGLASDHWNRVAGDVALMKAMGANAYRFSVEWSRLEPSEGTWDEAAWAHYVDEVDQLVAAGLTPMVTLLHFTLPQWLAEQGGLLAPGFPSGLGRLAAEAARRLGPKVSLWCTINEPNVQMFHGYLEGVWPPKRKSNEEAVKAMRALVQAHAAAAHALRTGDPDARIGAAIHLVAFEPVSKVNLLDWVSMHLSGNTFNWTFYDSIQAGRFTFNAPGFPAYDEPVEHLAGSVDYFGVNYYTRRRIRFAPDSPTLVAVEPGEGEKTDLGWEIRPEGLLQLLRAAHQRYGLPIHITENGLADEKGDKRGPYLRGHLYAVWRALQEGIPVRSYFHWSLMDNFEWAEGFRPRFGLYHVDYATQARTPAGGSEVFKTVATTGTLR